MFSAKIFVKYPESTFREEKNELGEYIGTYTVSLPCSLFLDEELTKEIGSYTITLDGLSQEQCTPMHIYAQAMSHFGSALHIA